MCAWALGSNEGPFILYFVGLTWVDPIPYWVESVCHSHLLGQVGLLMGQVRLGGHRVDYGSYINYQVSSHVNLVPLNSLVTLT